MLVVQVHRIHEGTVEIHLQLMGGSVPDANGARSPMSIEVEQFLLRQVPSPVNSIDELQGTVGI